ncbi:tetratricopeptide repeat protein [Candidatus Cyanaurora vandensis]
MSPLPLGWANALSNIGLIYERQGKKKEALKFLQQAQDIYLEIKY